MLITLIAASSISIAALAPASAFAANPSSVLSSTPDSLGRALGGSGRAKLVWDVLRAGGDPVATPPERLGRQARDRLRELGPPAYRLLTRSVAACGTTKLLLGLPAGDEVETVIIPNSEDNFSTLCVSSQVGCRQACSFCLTGTMGLQRSLGTGEILAQVHAAMAEVSGSSTLPRLRNVVFMGMGEPADNVPNVEEALAAMVHPHGFQLAKNHVCVSTVGPDPARIKRLSKLPARLAWSAHAADDGLRKLLVPTTRHSMAALRDAWKETLAERGDRGLMVEVTLIDGVNDGVSHADQLVELLSPLPGKTRVNVIPYNANAGLGVAGQLFQPSPNEAVRAFHHRVLERGLICTTRVQRGDDQSAACGQLATGERRRRQRRAGTHHPRREPEPRLT